MLFGTLEIDGEFDSTLTNNSDSVVSEGTKSINKSFQNISVIFQDNTMGNTYIEKSPENNEPSSRECDSDITAKPRRSILEEFDPHFKTSTDYSQIKDQEYFPLLSELQFEDLNNDVKSLCTTVVNDIVDEALHVISKQELDTTEQLLDTTQDMAESTDIMTLQTENANLKLKMNASQQVNASLELELRRKEEYILKFQSELLRTDQLHRQEIEALKEQLEKSTSDCDNTKLQELQDFVKLSETKEAKLINDLNWSKNEEQNYRKIMEEYEKTVAEQFSTLTKLEEEHETVKKHLANLELAFSDVHEKYERSKIIINGYRTNETTLRESLTAAGNNLQKYEEKYESLKAHAKAQIEKSNQEIQLVRDQQEAEIHKLNAFIKRLEIKIVSLEDLLDQKTKECRALSLLCDEVTGRVE